MKNNIYKKLFLFLGLFFGLSVCSFAQEIQKNATSTSTNGQASKQSVQLNKTSQNVKTLFEGPPHDSCPEQKADDLDLSQKTAIIYFWPKEIRDHVKLLFEKAMNTTYSDDLFAEKVSVSSVNLTAWKKVLEYHKDKTDVDVSGLRRIIYDMEAKL